MKITNDDMQNIQQILLSMTKRSNNIGIKYLTSDFCKEYGSRGFVGCVPLWRSYNVTFGLIARPNTAVNQWTGYAEQDGEALTISSSSSRLLLKYLYIMLFDDKVNDLRDASRLWPQLRNDLLELHKALGGISDDFARLENFIGTEEQFHAFDLDEENRTPFEAAMSELARELDPSVEFTRFANWLDRAIEGDLTIGSDLNLGCWQRMALTWPFLISKKSGQKAEIPEEEARNAVETFCFLDASRARSASWHISPGSGSVEMGQAALSEFIVEKGLQRSDYMGAIVLAVRERNYDYDGQAHAEAVPMLDEAGEPERAWGVLNSAAWWMARQHGEVPPAIFDGARLLCDRNGWDDMRWVIDRAMGQVA